jgi:hypothetical protein
LVYRPPLAVPTEYSPGLDDEAIMAPLPFKKSFLYPFRFFGVLRILPEKLTKLLQESEITIRSRGP